MAVDHYENFPVASLLLPRSLRPAVRDIYRYARSADDIADEGQAEPAERLAQLDAYRQALHRIGTGHAVAADDPLASVFAPLAGTIERHALPLTPFLDLLSAFSQDIVTPRYADEAALLDYCRRSANPVGRLMLHLYQAHEPGNLAAADALCTGLQLTNFWQDVAIDWRKGRVYLPQDALRRRQLSDLDIERWTQAEGPRTGDPAWPQWRALMQAQCERAAGLLRQGLPLTGRLPGRIGLELRLVAHGGLRILERLAAADFDMYHHRPVLRRRDWAMLCWRALR